MTAEIQNTNNIISGHSHSFDTGIAIQLGIHAAIVYNHIIYWIKINACKNENMFIDGKYWMFETQAQMAEFLEYMTVEEVKKAVVKLLNAGLLIKGNYNTNPFDKTAWYSVPDQSIIKKTLTKAPYGAIDNANGRDRERRTAPSLYINNNNKTVLFCVDAPPVAPLPQEKIFKTVKKNFEGQDIVVSKEDLYSQAVLMRKNWTKEEIENVWDILDKYADPMRDWFKFCEGTIENLRKTSKIKKLKEQPCQKKPTSKKQLNTIKDNDSENVTLVRFPQDWRQQVMPPKKS